MNIEKLKIDTLRILESNIKKNNELKPYLNSILEVLDQYKKLLHTHSALEFQVRQSITRREF